MKTVQIGSATLIRGDALRALATLPDDSVDLVLADPPYGTTNCAWDAVIPLDRMWRELERVTRPGASIVMTASQPFTTALIASNLHAFKYCWVWEKRKATGHLNCHKAPMRAHEDVVVFALPGPRTYNPQGLVPHPSPRMQAPRLGSIYNSATRRTLWDRTNYPRSMLRFDNDRGGSNQGLHPTQKPVALMEYLVRTYTHEGETVLDFTMGSGTTGVACERAGRRFIGIELDPTYYRLACARLRAAAAGADVHGRTGVGQKLRPRRKVRGDQARVPVRLAGLFGVVRAAQKSRAAGER